MPPATVSVEVPGSSYLVYVAAGLLGAAGEHLRSASDAGRAAVVTDERVAGLYLPLVSDSLRASNFDVSPVVIPSGEASKTWSRAGRTLDALAAAGLDRSDIVVALGGGVVGDLAGFCAAAYLRGIDFAQFPTTLLAQVDSSVGGKTGVDLAAGKNLAGAFKQPLIVLADTDTLDSLSQAEWASGLAEVAKVAILESEARFLWAEANAGALSTRQAPAVQEAVRTSVAFKAGVVAADERESGLRECLNYGHTLGHAIEKVVGYGTVPHGIAVAEGIRFAARLAVDACGATADLAERQERLLDAFEIPRVRLSVDPIELREAMSADKKARDGVPRFVLVTRPGDFTVRSVDEDLLEIHLQRFSAELGERG